MKNTHRWVAGLLSATMFFAAAPALKNGTLRASAFQEEVEGELAIDETNFPDYMFRKYILEEIDEDGSGTLSDAEISATKMINVYQKKIYDMTGISYFTSLKELYCSENLFTSLDLSSNTALQSLNVSSGQLASLNLENCSELKDLEVSNNFLTELDLTYCPSLVELGCDWNNLTSLKLLNNPKLERIECARNQMTALDVSYCPNLKSLNCMNNQLKSLDLSGCPSLEILGCFSNELTSLDVSANKSLTFLSCYKNPISSIDLSNNPALDFLNIGACNLTELDVSANTVLHTLHCYTNNLETLDVSACTELVKLSCHENKLTTLDVSMCPKLTDLSCYSNSLTELDVSQQKALEYLNIGDNRFTQIDLSENTKLASFYAGNNELTAIDVSNMPLLDILVVPNNHFRSLDLSACTELEWLNVDGNNLSALDLSNCPDVYQLSCEKNSIAKLNISGCPDLVSLTNTIPVELMKDGDFEYNRYFANAYYYFSLDTTTQLVSDAAPSNATVTFDSNGGSGSMAPVTVVEGKTINLPENAFTAPEGYVFARWEVGRPGEVYGVSCTQTIKAVWAEATNYAITVTTDGNGTAAASVASAFSGSLITLAAIPNSGYQFKQWQVIAGGVILADPSSATTTFEMVAENVEIKAIFEAVPSTPEPDPTTPVPGPSDPVDPQPGKEPSFEDFVERLYVVALGRASEPEGKAFWVDQVVNKGFTGADCARFFMLGAPEFLGRNLTDDEFVEVLYKTYFDRDSEPDGKAYWLGRLASGTERAVLVEEFIESVEWCNVCATYGVKSGARFHKATIPSKNAVKFATRLYTCCLGRDPEEEGLNYWSLALTNLDATGYQAASLFFTLPEFAGLKTSNEEYLTRLYKTFMGRDPEAEGFAYWLGLLNNGTDRNDVMKAFAGCPEFQEICNQYGIVRGEI